MAADDAPPTLPSPYAGWMTSLLGGPLPAEPRTTCDSCRMLSPGDAATGERFFFDPVTKCCTFMPGLPNFTVGRILADRDPALAYGRSTVLGRLRAGVSVSPLAIAWTPDFAARYTGGPEAFGRDPSLRCPHFTTDAGGTCGIWPHRVATCATYFCRFARGTVSRQFWFEVYRVLKTVENALARWCAQELGAVPEESAAAWGDWRDRREEFYASCADLVNPLSWTDVCTICGPEVLDFSVLVRKAYDAVRRPRVPERLRAGSWRPMGVTSHGMTVITYGILDPLSVSFTLLRLLPRFDGRPTELVLRELEERDEVRMSPSLLQRLVDHGLLIDAKQEP